MFALLQAGVLHACPIVGWCFACLNYCRMMVKHFSTLCIVSLSSVEMKPSKFYRHHKSRLS